MLMVSLSNQLSEEIPLELDNLAYLEVLDRTDNQLSGCVPSSLPGQLDMDVSDLNQYQGGMCISGRLTMTERTPRHLISPLGPNWVGTDSAV